MLGTCGYWLGSHGLAGCELRTICIAMCVLNCKKVMRRHIAYID